MKPLLDSIRNDITNWILIGLRHQHVPCRRDGDVVFDPYMGVGSSVIAAIKHGRHGVGCDLDPTYVNTAWQRVGAWENGTLKLRPLGKPIYQPTGREKISQIPKEWLVES